MKTVIGLILFSIVFGFVCAFCETNEDNDENN